MVSLDTFATDRLEADRLAPEHLDELLRMHRDERVMAHLGGVRDEAQTAAYLSRNLRHWGIHGFGLWILRERGGVEPVGRAVLRHLSIDDVDEVEVGYAFYESHWGRGLATEVTRACLDLARGPLRLDTVVALTSPGNAVSQRVLLKSGLTYERAFELEGLPCALFRTGRLRADDGPP